MKLIGKLLFVSFLLFSGAPFANPNQETYIFGGKKASENQFPFLVSLRILKDGTHKHHCGAAIISNRFILTAAHCYKSKTIQNDYRISVGARMREDQGEQYAVKQFVIHPKFNPVSKINDVAVIKTDKEIAFSAKAAAIKINRNTIDGRVNAIIAGWGKAEVCTPFDYLLDFITQHIFILG